MSSEEDFLRSKSSENDYEIKVKTMSDISEEVEDLEDYP